tara:strand:- start:22333 stop:23370 length:1038 start_codon:yes stop_codon:yes gene_type:complete
MYILLVAPPGIGKSTIVSEVARFWRDTEQVHVAPNSVTSASLIDVLRESGRVVQDIKSLSTWTYHSLLVASTEFTNLLPAYELGFVSALNEFYDCEKIYSEIRRGRKKEEQPDIPHPQMHMIAGTQPQTLGSVLPEAAWGQGFMSRNLLIHGGKQPKMDLFTHNPLDTVLEKNILTDLRTLSTLSGEFVWEPAASAALISWYKTEMAPAPTHLRLENYKTRRLLHFVKLCMAFCASRTNSMHISLLDHQNAMELMITTEAEMPQIFQSLACSDDAAIIDATYNFVLRYHAKKQAPVPRSLLLQFLAEQIPVYRVTNFLEVLEASSTIRRAPEGYTPGQRSRFDSI